MDAEKFIERINEAEKVLKYTFRLELEDDGADDLGKSLIERSACQAYKMFEPLIADRWSGHPFLTNRMLLKDSLCYEKRKELEEKIKESDEKTKEHDERIKKLDERIKKLDEIIKKPDEFDEKIKNILVKDAIASIYCMVREIIGEEDRITTYAAGEYAYFDEKAFEEEDEEEKEKYANEKKKKKRKNLSKFTTGMDDLLVRESYKFSEKGSLILEKGHIESDRSEILRSRNRALTRSITGLDNKLAGFLGYNPFITNKEVKVKSTDVKEGKVITIEKIENRPYLRISDLDMAAIFRRSSSRWNVIGKIAGTSNNDTIDIKYLCELNGLCKSLNSMDSIEHMTRADKLYVQIKIEKLLNYSALVCLWKNICELADSEYKVLFYDKESVKMLSDCFAMDNVIYRADFLNMEFESLKDYEELQEKEKNRVMDTWKTEIKDCLMKTIMRQNEEKENLTLNHWKDVYKEDVDIWANWAFPLFSSCFCVVLSKNILHKRLNGEKKQQQMIRIMYEELSEYINTNDVKLETMIMDENDFKVLAKNEIMLRAFSEYVRQALETIHKIKMPITLKEIDAMMPKKKQNFYLKYSKIQFLRRNEEALGSNINGITFVRSL